MIFIKSKKFIIFVIVAVAIKLALFVYSCRVVPETKYQNDTQYYLEMGELLVTEGPFFQFRDDVIFHYPALRTPGYPLFYGVFHTLLRIPDAGIVFLQIIVSIIGAFFVYKTALLIDERIAPMAALLMLFDPATTIFSQMLLADVLFQFFIVVFMFFFVRYMKEERLKDCVLSALTLAFATYTKPASFFLPAAVALFIVCFQYRRGLKKAIIHMAIFILVAHSVIGIWQARNYYHLGEWKFSEIRRATVDTSGLLHSYERNLHNKRNKDKKSESLPKVPYYLNVTSRSVVSLFTRPGTLKYFGSDKLKLAGKIFAFPFIAFWFLGFLVGAGKANNWRLFFLLYLIGYFSAVTVTAALWGAGPRFRMPMMPAIVILASYGWLFIPSVFYKPKC